MHGLMIICYGQREQGPLRHDQEEKSMGIRADVWGQQNKHNAQNHTHTHAQNHTLMN